MGIEGSVKGNSLILIILEMYQISRVSNASNYTQEKQVYEGE